MIRITFFENPQDTTGTTIEAEDIERYA